MEQPGKFDTSAYDEKVARNRKLAEEQAQATELVPEAWRPMRTSEAFDTGAGFRRDDPSAFGPEDAKTGETIAKGEWKDTEVSASTERMRETDKTEADIRYGEKE